MLSTRRDHEDREPAAIAWEGALYECSVIADECRLDSLMTLSCTGFEASSFVTSWTFSLLTRLSSICTESASLANVLLNVVDTSSVDSFITDDEDLNRSLSMLVERRKPSCEVS